MDPDLDIQRAAVASLLHPPMQQLVGTLPQQPLLGSAPQHQADTQAALEQEVQELKVSLLSLQQTLALAPLLPATTA